MTSPSFADIPPPNEVAEELIRRGGITPSPDDRAALETNPYDPSPEHVQQLEVLGKAAFKGFFSAAQVGYEFAPIGLIGAKFGGTLERNYPEAGTAFLRFARSYWTLKLVTDHMDYSPTEVSGHAIVSEVESMVASVFFPTPGPISIDPDQREQTQRKILAEHCPDIDVEDFISRNPILLRDRGGGVGGCGGTAAAVLFIAALATWQLLGPLELAA